MITKDNVTFSSAEVKHVLETCEAWEMFSKYSGDSDIATGIKQCKQIFKDEFNKIYHNKKQLDN